MSRRLLGATRNGSNTLASLVCSSSCTADSLLRSFTSSTRLIDGFLAREARVLALLSTTSRCRADSLRALTRATWWDTGSERGVFIFVARFHADRFLTFSLRRFFARYTNRQLGPHLIVVGVKDHVRIVRN